MVQPGQRTSSCYVVKRGTLFFNSLGNLNASKKSLITDKYQVPWKGLYCQTLRQVKWGE